MGKVVQLMLAAGLIGASGVANALSSMVIDTEALAMGGAGVSSATDNLGHINPALVGSDHRSDKEFYMIPSIHYLDYDINDFKQKLDVFQDNPTAKNLSAFDEGGIYYNWAMGFGVVLVSPEAVSTLYVASYSQSYSQLRLDEGDLTAPPGSDFTSVIETSGLTIVEVGVSYTRDVSWPSLGINDAKFGITGKVLTGVLHQNEVGVENASVDGLYDQGESGQGFTMDLGLFKEWGYDWAAGVVVKNLYPVKLPLPDGDDYFYGPQIRAGITRFGYRYRIAMDLDLVKSRPLGVYDSTQMISLGADYDIGGYLKLRTGVNYDLQGNLPETYSVGMGIHSEHFQVSLALMANSGEFSGMGLQTAVAF